MSAPAKAPTPHPTAGTARPARGRRPERELAAIRERVETFMLTGLRAPAIHRALTAAESPNPIVISEHQVRVHMKAVERGWAERTTAETLERDRARAIASVEETMRISLARSARNAASNVGVGYLNVHLKAQEQFIRLRGLDAPTRHEVSGPGGGPLVLADHPADHLEPREEARRLRQLAADRDAEADAAEADVAEASR